MIENIRSGSTLPSRMTLSDIIRNALDRGYSLVRVAADLGALMMERESIRRRGDTEAPRLRELEHMLPMQEAFTPKASQLFKEYALVAGRFAVVYLSLSIVSSHYPYETGGS